MTEAERPLVVKVGGSLFDLPDLGTRLRCWLDELDAHAVVLVPGGGATAEVVRALDRCHSLGEEAAHWLALRAVSVNACFLQALLPSARVIRTLSDERDQDRLAILDAYAFARADEGHLGCLPHSWDVSSDAIAARAAVVAGAGRLWLLKSLTIPPGLSWAEAGRLGYVDRRFAAVLRQAPRLEVSAFNLRAWQPG